MLLNKDAERGPPAATFRLLHGALEAPEQELAAEGGQRLFSDLLIDGASLGVLAASYMAVSTGLITFNKYLMHDGRFPFVIFIGMMHMSFSLLCNTVLYQVCPSLYPALTDPAKKVTVDRTLIIRVLLPIAGCFAAQLVLSNMAFMHSSLAFLQMMKQSNVVLVYFFSLALSLEHFSWKRAAVLAFIVAATGLTVHGELHFSFSGFAIQGVSMLCESFKLTLQSYSLSASGRRLDALTFVMLLSPLVLLVLLALLLALQVLWPGRPAALMLPPWASLLEYWGLLLANGCLAFAMNVAHALFIKRSSATTFILTGVIMKDVVIVVVGALVLGELLSPLQVVGFAMQLVAILVWSWMKAAPLVLQDAAETTPKVGGWEEVRLEDGKAASPKAPASGSDKSAWCEAGVALVPTSRHPASLHSRTTSESTGTPLNEEESCPSDGTSPCGEGL